MCHVLCEVLGLEHYVKIYSSRCHRVYNIEGRSDINQINISVQIIEEL